MNGIYKILLMSLGFMSLDASALTKNDSLFAETERVIAGLSDELGQTRFKDALQDSLGLQMFALLGDALRQEDSFEYPFDSLKSGISIVLSDDRKLRIFTWFTVGDAGDYHYYGYLQYNDHSLKGVRLFSLIDRSDSIPDYESQTLTPNNWYGMLYYGIVETKGSGGTIYTLLGWDGCGLYTTKKIVEPMMLTVFGEPRFGKPMIKIGHAKYKRIVFEYNKRATMMIQYDVNLGVIVMDHLSVFGDQDTDSPMFLGPDMSYDALKFEDGMWLYQPNIQYMRPKAKRR